MPNYNIELSKNTENRIDHYFSIALVMSVFLKALLKFSLGSLSSDELQYFIEKDHWE